MAGTTPVLSVRSFSVLGRSGIERVGTVWLTGDFFGIIMNEITTLLEPWLNVQYMSFTSPGEKMKQKSAQSKGVPAQPTKKLKIPPL